MLQPHVDVDLASLRYYFCAEGHVNGVPAVIARTGYTGEDGFELFVDGERCPEIWNALLRDHRRRRTRTVRTRRARRAAPRGRHAALRTRADRDDHAGSSRLTVGAQDSTSRSSSERKRSNGQLELDDYSRIVGLVMEGRAPAREGYPVWLDGRIVGSIRSGSIAPSVDNKNVATALVANAAATVGTRLEVEIRGTNHERDGRFACRFTNAQSKRKRRRHGAAGGLALQQGTRVGEARRRIATIGITDYAQNALGDIVYVELPKVGTTIEQFRTSA